jgi:hypothetical protein
MIGFAEEGVTDRPYAFLLVIIQQNHVLFIGISFTSK